MNLREAKVIQADQVILSSERTPRVLTHRLPASGTIFSSDLSSMGSSDVTARSDTQCNDCACGLIY